MITDPMIVGPEALGGNNNKGIGGVSTAADCRREDRRCRWAEWILSQPAELEAYG